VGNLSQAASSSFLFFRFLVLDELQRQVSSEVRDLVGQAQQHAFFSRTRSSTRSAHVLLQ
jgi:hypothetical protein